MNNSKQTDLMAMDVTWFLEDLELYETHIGVGKATILTISTTINFMFLVQLIHRL